MDRAQELGIRHCLSRMDASHLGVSAALWVRGEYKPGRILFGQEREESHLQGRMEPPNACYLSEFLGVLLRNEWLPHLYLKQLALLAPRGGLLVPGAVHWLGH